MWSSIVASGTTYVRSLLTLLCLALCGTAAAQVGVNKSFNPISTPVGQTSVVTITLLNPASSAATAATVSDTLPTNVLIANPANASTTCGGTLTATSATALIALAGGTIPRRRVDRAPAPSPSRSSPAPLEVM